jgi:hypothetical protein
MKSAEETRHGDTGTLKVIFASPLGDMQAPSRFVMQAQIEAEDKYELQKEIKLSKQL